MPSEPVAGVLAAIDNNSWFRGTRRRLSDSAGREIRLFCSAEGTSKAEALMSAVSPMLDMQTPVLPLLDENGSRLLHSWACPSCLPAGGIMTHCCSSFCIQRGMWPAPIGRLMPRDSVTPQVPYRGTPCTPTPYKSQPRWIA